MLKAQEALALTINAINDRMTKGREKARKSILVIDKAIIAAARDGIDYIIIYPLQMYDFDTCEERAAYIAEILNTLAAYDYKVTYNENGESMKIVWGE